MFLEDLLEITSSDVEVYIGNSSRPIYHGSCYAVPQELLCYKISKISSSHYYPYYCNDESVDCLDIELISED